MNLGYLGVGNMGGALARRLVGKFPLTVFDLSGEAVRGMVDVGATAAGSTRALAEASDIVLTCLPTTGHLHEAVLGPGGLAEGLRPGTMIIDQTTGDPGETKLIAEALAPRSIELVDAPVSGGPPGAAAGTIAVMVGASEEQFQRIKPILDAISVNVFHAGPAGSGHVMKLVNNMLSSASRLLSYEMIALAVKNGVDAKTAVSIIQKGSGRNYHLETTIPQHVLTGKFFQGFTVGLMFKDVALATKLGRDSGVPMSFSNLAHAWYQASINRWGPDEPVNMPAIMFQEMAGVEFVPPDYTTKP